jgi:hypothetical protein
VRSKAGAAASPRWIQPKRFKVEKLRPVITATAKEVVFRIL